MGAPGVGKWCWLPTAGMCACGGRWDDAWQDRLPTDYGVSSKPSGVGCRGSRAVPAPFCPLMMECYSLDIVLLLLCHLDRSGEISFSYVTKLLKNGEITKRFTQINWHKCPQRSTTGLAISFCLKNLRIFRTFAESKGSKLTRERIIKLKV